MATAADLIARLLLETQQFDTNLTKSTKQIQNFQAQARGIGKSVSGSFSSVIGVAGKLVPAFAAVTGGIAAFNATIKSSEGLTDAYGRVTESATAVTNRFFRAIGSGDFSVFIGGLKDVIQNAKDAYDAIDNLGTLSAFQDIDLAKIQTQKLDIQYQIKLAKKAGNDELVKQLYDQLVGMDNQIAKMAQEKAQAATEAYQAALKEAVGGQTIRVHSNSRKISDEYVMAMANQWAGSWDNGDGTGFKYINERIEAMKKQYEDSEKLVSELQAKIPKSQFEGNINSTRFGQLKYNTAESNAWNQELQRATNLKIELYVLEQIAAQEAAITEAKKYQLAHEQAMQSVTQARMQSLMGLEKETTKQTKTETKYEPLQRIAMPSFNQGKSVEDINRQISYWKKKYEQAGDDFGRAMAQKQIKRYEQELKNLQIPPIFQEAMARMSAKIEIPKLDGGTNFTNDFADANEELVKMQDNLKIASTFGNLLTNSLSASGESGAAAFAQILSATIPLISAIMALTVAEGEEKAARSSQNWVELIAAVGAVTAAIVSAFATGKSAGKYAEGGIVGGNSYSGDRLVANVNSGEMILNKQQQANLFNLIDGGASNKSAGPNDVVFKLKGTELIGLINNTRNKYNKLM